MSFDPEAFKHVQIEGAMDIEVVPPDEGIYNAQVDKWDIQGGTSQKTGDPWARLDITWELEDSNGEQKEKTGRDKITARQQLFLDLTEDGSKLDTGKGRNVALGRLREALGLNDPDRAFSFDMLDGQPAQVMVRHRTSQQGNVFPDVAKVAGPNEDIS